MLHLSVISMIHMHKHAYTCSIILEQKETLTMHKRTYSNWIGSGNPCEKVSYHFPFPRSISMLLASNKAMVIKPNTQLQSIIFPRKIWNYITNKHLALCIMKWNSKLILLFYSIESWIKSAAFNYEGG